VFITLIHCFTIDLLDRGSFITMATLLRHNIDLLTEMLPVSLVTSGLDRLANVH
jgi:hypothetical protein